MYTVDLKLSELNKSFDGYDMYVRQKKYLNILWAFLATGASVKLGIFVKRLFYTLKYYYYNGGLDFNFTDLVNSNILAGYQKFSIFYSMRDNTLNDRSVIMIKL